MFNNNGSMNKPFLPAMLLQKRGGFYFPGTMTGPASTSITSPAAAATPAASLYSGKWTLEEEQYVTFLCEEFKAGSLDVTEGKSLRSFLADQLGCNAKRISKKYERTGYNGKLQYVDKRSTMTSQAIATCREKMELFDRRFKESRETLKFVEASRKRDPTTFSYEEPAQKRLKMALLSPITTHLVATGSEHGRGLHSPLMAGPSTIGISGLLGRTNVLNSLLVRTSILAQERQQAPAHSNDLVQASMLSALQKYQTPLPVPGVGEPYGSALVTQEGTLNPSLASRLALQRSLIRKIN